MDKLILNLKNVTLNTFENLDNIPVLYSVSSAKCISHTKVCFLFFLLCLYKHFISKNTSTFQILHYFS